MKNIVVFCGSSPGYDPVYMEQARLLGATLAQRNIGLVYGGAKVGLMGAVADGALQAGGQVHGVLPRFLQEKELAHTGLTTLLLVDTMHERKTKMNELADGVIALPGGFGTMEELFEMLTWGQLGLHKKPIALLNINGFYDALNQLSQTMTDQGFLSAPNRSMLLCSNSIDDLLTQMENYRAPEKDKWLTKEKT
ncbi:TIGR00730 family Rossman fold protein [Chitinophaga sp. Mgbs1]|uniref:Cytokinin riboside 5'-monophosphate phosphoribohydrolase n=1 Tax=Chitinophaga solisilvae TaxID=1233460 RepID=A0A3S1BGT5_9BACT|nr:TIGR00730 family Rossman fold protein [Chitinophaga solisilvae]